MVKESKKPVKKGKKRPAPETQVLEPLQEGEYNRRAMKSLRHMVNTTLTVEGLRISNDIRRTHLKLQGIIDPECEDLAIRLNEFEAYTDGRVAMLIKSHPAYPWFSRVKGIGRENIGKIVGFIRVEPEISENKALCTVCGKPVKIIEMKTHECKGLFQDLELKYAGTISGLWKYAGFSVENGKAPKPIKGEKLSYNSQLRTMCWRVAGSLLKQKGCFYEYYCSQKERYIQRLTNEGVKIVPASELPKNSDKKRHEPEGIISEGHVHYYAQRKMIKLFLSCLWLTWREARGLPVTKPYSIDQLGHSHYVDPWDMVDR